MCLSVLGFLAGGFEVEGVWCWCVGWGWGCDLLCLMVVCSSVVGSLLVEFDCSGVDCCGSSLVAIPCSVFDCSGVDCCLWIVVVSAAAVTRWMEEKMSKSL